MSLFFFVGVKWQIYPCDISKVLTAQRRKLISARKCKFKWNSAKKKDMYIFKKVRKNKWLTPRLNLYKTNVGSLWVYFIFSLFIRWCCIFLFNKFFYLILSSNSLLLFISTFIPFLYSILNSHNSVFRFHIYNQHPNRRID